jgi:hypothetical protein
MPASKPLDSDSQRIERLQASNWQKSHWRKFESAEEHAERVERAEHEAGRYFQAATVRQKAVYDASMACIRGLDAPCYRRWHRTASAEWARSTVEAADLYQITAEAIFVHGECPEEIAALWDDLEVRQAVAAAMEDA